MAKDKNKSKAVEPDEVAEAPVKVKGDKVKGDKPAKVKGDKPAKVSDDFAAPSDAPNTGGDGWKFETDDNLGDLYLITPLRTEYMDDAFSPTPGATKEVIVCDIVALNEKKPAKSELHADAWVFGGWTKGSLRGYIGERMVLARLGQGPAGKGGQIPWILEDCDNDDKVVAKAYLASVDPFAVKGAKSKAA